MMGAGPALHYFDEDATAAIGLADALGIRPSVIALHRFPDGESLPRVETPGGLAIVYRSLAPPDAKLFPLALSADALRRGGTRRVVLAAPYLPYMRQDEVFRPGEPISQSVLATFLRTSFDRLVTVDAHLHRTRSLKALYAPGEADDLASTRPLAEWVRTSGQRPDLIVGPDEESGPWVQAIGGAIGCAWLTMRKVRHGDAAVDVVLGIDDAAAISGRRVLLVDDICSSGGTLRQAVHALRRAGAADVQAYVTHALFDDRVEKAVRAAGASVLVSSDSVPHPSNAVSLRDVLADALLSEVRSARPDAP